MGERLASLVSGEGTTMERVVIACQSGEVPMDVACVVASSPEIGGVRRARELGVPLYIVNPRNFLDSSGETDQELFGLALLKVLEDCGATVVTQNGWMPKTPDVV